MVCMWGCSRCPRSVTGDSVLRHLGGTQRRGRVGGQVVHFMGKRTVFLAWGLRLPSPSPPQLLGDQLLGVHLKL